MDADWGPRTWGPCPAEQDFRHSREKLGGSQTRRKKGKSLVALNGSKGTESLVRLRGLRKNKKTGR